MSWSSCQATRGESRKLVSLSQEIVQYTMPHKMALVFVRIRHMKYLLKYKHIFDTVPTFVNTLRLVKKGLVVFYERKLKTTCVTDLSHVLCDDVETAPLLDNYP